MTVFVDVVGRGPNLTMLHGWGFNGAVWNGVRVALAERYTLHIIDLPGHGHSQGAMTDSLSAMADAIANAMPKRSHLLGWSLGGQLALELARRHADRIHKILLVATTPCFLKRQDWPHAVSQAVLADFGARFAADASATIRRFLALQVLRLPNVHAAMAALEDAVMARGTVNPLALAASLSILETTDLRAQLRQINHATLVLQGDHDALTPEPAGRWLAGELPNARYVMMAHAAHAPFLSHRDAFLNDVNKFLAA